MKVFLIGGTGLLGSEKLGVTEDDIDAAIGESMRLCADILDGRSDAIDMCAGIFH